VAAHRQADDINMSGCEFVYRMGIKGTLKEQAQAITSNGRPSHALFVDRVDSQRRAWHVVR